jgi:hypothetical protein
VTGGIEPERRRAGAPLPVDAPATFLLSGAVLASGALLLVLGSRITFFLDDWEFLLYRPGWTAHSLLDPHNEHISLIPVVVYKTLLATFGMSSAFPFHVVSTLLFLLSAVLLFVYLRRRVADWLALIGTTVILFLGAAYEDLLWPFQIGFFGSMTCGLGMLLALEREDRTGDRLACALLTLSIAFSSLGLPFAAGAAVDLWQRRQRWRGRIYVVAIPALLFAVWWLGWGHTADTAVSLHNIGTTPLFVLNALADGIASLLGLVNSTTETVAPGGLDWGRAILPVVVVFLVWRLHQIGKLPRSFWVALAIGAGFWILAGVNAKVGRGPTAPRYQYPSAIFILLITAELLRGVRVGRTALIATSVIAAAAVGGNLSLLISSYKSWKHESELERADLGAVEIIRDRVPPAFTLLPAVADTRFVSVGAGAYLEAADDFGSPAYTPAELAASPEPAREAADKVLAAGLGIKLAPTRAPSSPTAGPRPDLIGPPEALLGSKANCVTLNATHAAPPLLDLPPGGAALASHSRGAFHVRLRRFASSTVPVDLGELPADASAVIEIPTDRSAQPWKLSLDGAGPVIVCGQRPNGA